jgi:hypothetical protein
MLPFIPSRALRPLDVSPALPSGSKAASGFACLGSPLTATIRCCMAGVGVVWASVAAVPAAARADVFLLASGGQVEGEYLNRDELPRTRYVVRLESGGELVLPAKAVSNVVVRTDVQRRYEELLPKMPPTVEGHWKMAEWCRERSLESIRETHLREILKLDPEHEKARSLLGYQRLSGRWMTTEEYRQSLGYVRHGADWKLPQEVELLVAREQWRKEELQWKQRLRVLRGKVGKKGGERAVDDIRAVRDPAATAALVQMLEDRDESRDMKMLYLDVLAKLGSSGAINALAKRSIYEDDTGIREKSLDLLERFASPRLAESVAERLRDENNTIVNRAALVLERFGEHGVTPELIEALTTKHKQTVGSGSGITPSFSGDGGAGLSMGGGPKVVVSELQNGPVLAALAALYPGVSFGYDKAAWKRWYAATQTPRGVDLRRDP